MCEAAIATVELTEEEEEKFKEYVTKFLNDCNNDGAKTTTWIIKVAGFRKGNPPVVTRVAFESGAGFVQEKFIHWWDSTYLKMDNPEFDYTSVDIYTNYTPTEICSPRLGSWLKGNKNVTILTLYFAHVYTWNEERRVVPKLEYVRRLQDLSRCSDRTVKIQKVDASLLEDLAKDVGVPFAGYRDRWYPNRSFESEIIDVDPIKNELESFPTIKILKATV